MPTLMHELDSAPPTNHLRQNPRYVLNPATAPPQQPILTLPYLRLILSPTYHAHAPNMPSLYASNAATPCPPSPILMLPQPHCHPMSTLTPPYASTECPKYASDGVVFHINHTSFNLTKYDNKKCRMIHGQENENVE
ncbi:hypothetical protein O181_034963 [Austropuccinia psidii MF-1]|uniref:Uncharacterized protein n=1 Tax=Austropuccinia psidii MF-1 TaxID=1389203 RepID=A0A9Q3H7U8_9BASI|nr:hypothetical protein [Austropuccinia psidii MF-1]